MRPALHRQPTIDPSTLSKAERDRLAHELTELQQQIFAGVGAEASRAYVIDSPAHRTRIEVFRDEDGAAVVFAAIHLFVLPLDGRTVHVLRTEVGLLPAYRGQSAAGRLLAREAARARLRCPHRPLYSVACPVHPASDLALARAAETWPRPGVPTPPALEALMSALDQELSLQRPQAAGPHVRKVGWITRQTVQEEAWWAAHDHELVRFYLDENPDQTSGTGLRTVSPVGVGALVMGVGRLGLRQLRRARHRVALPGPAFA